MSWALLLLVISPLCALTIETNLTSQTLYLGDEVTVILKVDGAERGAKLLLPTVGGLNFRQLGNPLQSSQTTFVNGKITSFSGLQYTIAITASQLGSYTIPPFQVEFDGERAEGEQLTLRVVKPGEVGSMKVVVESSSKALLLQQPITVTLKWYLQEDVAEYNFRFPLLDQKEDLKLELIDPPQGRERAEITIGNYKVPFHRTQEIFNGENYTLFYTQFRIYPTDVGEFIIPEASVKASIQSGTTLKRDFFNRLQRVPSYREVFAISEKLSIQVRDLPQEDRPAHFSKGVGEFQIAASISESRAKVGDPITIKITISGKGRLDQIEKPLLSEIPAFKADFEIDENLQPGEIQGDAITFEQVVRPKHERVTTIPAIPFAFYNPDQGRYITTTSEPVPLKVLPARRLNESDIVVNNGVTNSAPNQELEETKHGIRANYTFEDALTNQTTNSYALFLLPLPPIAYFGLLLFVTRRRRLHGNQAKLRSSKAKGSLKKRLKVAEDLLSAGGTPFFQALAKALTGYISDRLNLGQGELTPVDIEKLRKEGRLREEFAAQVVRLLEELDRIRFTNISLTETQKTELLQRVQTLISQGL